MCKSVCFKNVGGHEVIHSWGHEIMFILSVSENRSRFENLVRNNCKK